MTWFAVCFLQKHTPHDWIKKSHQVFENCEKDLHYPNSFKFKWIAELNTAIMVVVFVYSWADYECSGDLFILSAIFKKLVAFLILSCFCRKQQIKSSSHKDNFCKNYGKYSKSDRFWSWSDCSQTPKVDHDRDLIVHKLKKINNNLIGFWNFVNTFLWIRVAIN